MNEPRRCSACVHYREGVPPDPMAGIRLVSKKVLELRAKWQQELATRATFEQERLESGKQFDFEPWAFPYCDHFSDRTVQDAVSGESHTIYVLCAVQNPHSNCPEFKAREQA